MLIDRNVTHCCSASKSGVSGSGGGRGFIPNGILVEVHEESDGWAVSNYLFRMGREFG